MTSNPNRVDTEVVTHAIEELGKLKIGRTAKSGIMSYFLLKAKGAVTGASLTLKSTGPEGAKSELDKYFGFITPDGIRHLNPFGETKWYEEGFERFGVYTHLYPGRTLGFLGATRADDGGWSVFMTAAAAIAFRDLIGTPLPLQPVAAFLLRGHEFRQGATAADLVDEFKRSFNFADAEMNALFIDATEFDVSFSESGFDGQAASLPRGVRPPPTGVGPATAGRAAAVTPFAQGEMESLILPDQVLSRARRALAVSKAVALVGPPGTGKSRLATQLIGEARADPAAFRLTAPPTFDRYAAEVDWTARMVIGGHYPDPGGKLVFREGLLLRAIRGNRWVILDEMNRADLDRVLGPALTFLAGEGVDLGVVELGDSAKPMSLGWSADAESRVVESDDSRLYLAGTDWRLLGTYNNVDLGRVFSMGSALARRWAIILVPPVASEEISALLRRIEGCSESAAAVIAKLYELHLQYLPLGPAPFLDMARYVASDEDRDEHIRVADSYLIYLAVQLERISPEQRQAFDAALASVLGEDFVNEYRAL